MKTYYVIHESSKQPNQASVKQFGKWAEAQGYLCHLLARDRWMMDKKCVYKKRNRSYRVSSPDHITRARIIISR